MTVLLFASGLASRELFSFCCKMLMKIAPVSKRAVATVEACCFYPIGTKCGWPTRATSLGTLDERHHGAHDSPRASGPIGCLGNHRHTDDRGQQKAGDLPCVTIRIKLAVSLALFDCRLQRALHPLEHAAHDGRGSLVPLTEFGDRVDCQAAALPEKSVLRCGKPLERRPQPGPRRLRPL